MTDIHQKFLNAQGAAVAWVGAWLGPTLLLIGTVSDTTRELVAGALLTAFPVIFIVGQIRSTRVPKLTSDTLAFAIVQPRPWSVA